MKKNYLCSSRNRYDFDVLIPQIYSCTGTLASVIDSIFVHHFAIKKTITNLCRGNYVKNKDFSTDEFYYTSIFSSDYT